MRDSATARNRALRPFKQALHVLGVACVILVSGCATAFVRSNNTAGPDHVYPATAFDGELFWKAGVKGEPLFVMVDPNHRSGPVARIACAVGAIIDLPFSIVFDTLLLPIDLTRSGPPAKDTGTNGEPDGPANGSQPICSGINRTSSAADLGVNHLPRA